MMQVVSDPNEEGALAAVRMLSTSTCGPNREIALLALELWVRSQRVKNLELQRASQIVSSQKISEPYGDNALNSYKTSAFNLGGA